MTIRNRFSPLGKSFDTIQMVTLTINPTPSNATVTLTASGYTQSSNSITVLAGTSVFWSVAYTNCNTVSGTQVVNSNTTLSKSVTCNLIGKSNPTGATVKVTQGSNSSSATSSAYVTVAYGTTPTWSVQVSKTDYTTHTVSYSGTTITAHTTKTVGINPSTLIDITSSSKTVTINAQAKFNVLAVGGGGGGATTVSNGTYSYCAGGGSGACFAGVVTLPAGSCVGTCGTGGSASNTVMTNASAGSGGNTTIKVGSTTYVTCKGGGGAKATSVGPTKGSGADTPSVTNQVSSTTKKAGNDGKTAAGTTGSATAAGGSSVNSGTTQGAGGKGEFYLGSYISGHQAVAGNNGRLKITMSAYS